MGQVSWNPAVFEAFFNFFAKKDASLSERSK